MSFGAGDLTPAAGVFHLIGPGDHTLGVPSNTHKNIMTDVSSENQFGQFEIETDTAQVIKTRASDSNGDINIFIDVNGWVDSRGKDA